MIATRWPLMSGVIMISLVVAPDCIARQQVHIEKARVRFLATSWMVRGTWGLNEDRYLAEITSARNDAPILVQLIDIYPNESSPLSQETLTSQIGTPVRITRDTRCDIPFEQMAFRTAPGDPMAILPKRLGYQPRLARAHASGEVLPCYRLVRK